MVEQRQERHAVPVVAISSPKLAKPSPLKGQAVRYCSFTVRLLLLLAGICALVAPVRADFFSDVPANDADQFVIENAVMNQLMEGYPDGTFHPESSLRRVEGMMVMARLLNVAYRGFMILPTTTAAEVTMKGIPAKHWVYPAAKFLAEHGILDRDAMPTALADLPLGREDLLNYFSRLMHGGRVQPASVTAKELADRRILPDGWLDDLALPVTRRELARVMDVLLEYLAQHAVAEGTITAFETDDNGDRWVHLSTPIGEARLCMPVRGVIVQGGSDESVREGMKVRTLSDVVSGTKAKPYFRVREVTILPQTASR